MKLLIKETYLNMDGYPEGPAMIGETDWFEPYASTRGAVFRDARAEYGGCIGKIHLDRKITGTEAQTSPFPLVPAAGKRSERWVVDDAGWVFSKRMRYEGARPDPHTGRYKASDYYTREVWVQVRITPEEETP